MLELTALVDCAKCDTTYDGRWTDDSLSVQDMAEPPEAVQECPGCGHEQLETYPGWCWQSEAG
jgi:hypothetical protein